MGEAFWLILTVACVVWYSTITFYVAIKGVGDIKNILKSLKSNLDENKIE